MPSSRDIPGFYYDTSKNRYFPVSSRNDPVQQKGQLIQEKTPLVENDCQSSPSVEAKVLQILFEREIGNSCTSSMFQQRHTEMKASKPWVRMSNMVKSSLPVVMLRCTLCFFCGVGNCLGAVLMQEGRVIAYESRMFSKPEMTTQIYEKELLAVIHVLTQWRHYLLGADFTVFTDHQSLRYFLSQKQLSEKQMRWANILSQFHFQIVHVQGQKNVMADALSRKPLVQAISAIHHSTFEDMADQYATDTDFADIFTRIRDGETVAGYCLREGYLMRKTMLCVT
ncbi:hypothetical protein L7F22_067814 [Adiantum nelumboides]|nr:hypothetical protein [Adiantum nelumboides]